jgi:hypothetical protein
MAVRVSAKRIEQINAARLGDAAGARIVRAAASAPHLWAYVHPDVKNALVMLEAKIGVTGTSGGPRWLPSARLPPGALGLRSARGPTRLSSHGSARSRPGGRPGGQSTG